MSSAPADLRRGVPSDLDAILALERATENAPHWPAAVYAAMLDTLHIGPAGATPLHHSDGPRRCLLVAQASTSLVAFAVAMVHPSPGEIAPPHPQSTSEGLAELETLVVATSARRSGIGRALCRALLDWCKSQGAVGVVLEVRAASTSAIALYSGLGFKQLGQRLGYYRDPEDNAVIMRLQLD